MRYSTNLNIIIKAIEKATARMSRDYIELENLQSNVFSANKFVNSCYQRAKEVLFDDLSKIRPDYNIFFSDGQKIIRDEKAEYSYVIFPIDGLENLSRANPDFTVAVALQHLNESGQTESISLAVSKIFGGEIYYCEKGFGAYLNNRRIRVSKRSMSDSPLIETKKPSALNDKFLPRHYGCNTLALSYLASCRLDGAIFESNALLKPFLLLVKEAGGKVEESSDLFVASNGIIDLKI